MSDYLVFELWFCANTKLDIEHGLIGDDSVWQITDKFISKCQTKESTINNLANQLSLSLGDVSNPATYHMHQKKSENLVTFSIKIY